MSDNSPYDNDYVDEHQVQIEQQIKQQQEMEARRQQLHQQKMQQQAQPQIQLDEEVVDLGKVVSVPPPPQQQVVPPPPPDPLANHKRLLNRMHGEVQGIYSRTVEKRASEIIEEGMTKEMNLSSSETIEQHAQEKTEEFSKMIRQYRFGKDQKQSKKDFIAKRDFDDKFKSSEDYSKALDQLKGNNYSGYELDDPDDVRKLATYMLEKMKIDIEHPAHSYAHRLVSEHLIADYLQGHDPNAQLKDLRGEMVEQHNQEFEQSLNDKVEHGVYDWKLNQKEEFEQFLEPKDRQKYQQKREKFEKNKDKQGMQFGNW